MRSNHTILAALFLSGATASVAVADPVATEWHRGPESCGTPQIPGAETSPVFDFAANTQRIIYVNKTGGHFTVANTDATKNTVSNNILQTSVSQFDIAPMESTWDWATIRPCLEKAFKPFNVRIVETRPATGTYIESVVGGTGAEIGFSPQSGILGITSTDNFCHVAETGITLSFSKNHVGIPRATEELCGTIAHETGHALSLEHEILSPDLMSYVPISQSGTKAFVTQDSQCGTDSQSTNPCSCTASTTNSGARLTANVGARPTDGTAPSLTVSSPGADGKVAPAFNVVATATDASGMADVVVSIDGTEVGNDEVGANNKWTIPVVTTEGTHMMKVVARDLAGNVTEKDISITAAKLAIGETCTGNEACAGNICANQGGQMFCTQTCTTTPDSCPAGFACDATAKVCASDGSSGGCCSVSDPRSGVTALFFGLCIGGVLLRKRRSN